MVTSEHYWQYASCFLCHIPIIFPKKRNTTSHWPGGTAFLNQEGIILTSSWTLYGMAAENSSAFLWTNTVGAVRAEVMGKAGWQRAGWQLWLGSAGRGPWYPLCLCAVGRGICVHLWEKQWEKENTEPSGDSWRWGSWDPGWVSVKGISDTIISCGVFSSNKTTCRNPKYCQNRDVRQIFFISKESKCKHLFM